MRLSVLTLVLAAPLASQTETSPVAGLEPLAFTVGTWTATATLFAPDGSAVPVEGARRVTVHAVGGGRFLVMAGHDPADPAGDGELWIFQPDPATGGLLARGTSSDDTDVLTLTGGSQSGVVRLEGRLGVDGQGPPIRFTFAPHASGVRLTLEADQGTGWRTVRHVDWVPAAR